MWLMFNRYLLYQKLKLKFFLYLLFHLEIAMTRLFHVNITNFFMHCFYNFENFSNVWLKRSQLDPLVCFYIESDAITYNR